MYGGLCGEQTVMLIFLGLICPKTACSLEPWSS